ncbi:MAG: sialate O-acetylesterase [Desulfobacterales bacterium]|nr:sialate O-acetylesterase [Desulfobacterales bacterium]
MLKKALIIFFLIAVLAPIPAWLLWGAPSSPEMDFPSPYNGALIKTDYYRALDRYINEQAAFGGRLRRIKNWIDYRLWGRSDHKDIHVGRRGWLFRRADIENHVQDRCADPGDARRRLIELHAVEKVVSATGRDFRFIVVPSKASVYPEYVGWVPLPATGRCSAFDRMREADTAYPLNAWVPLEAAIMAGKFGSHLLYDPTGRYWNGRGAAVAAEALHLSLFGISTLAPVMTLERRPNDLKASLLGRAAPPVKNTVRRVEGEGREGLGRMLLYGDGGSDNLLPHLARMAMRVDVVATETIPSRQVAEDWRGYDCILFQTTEAEIGRLRIDIDRIYDQLIAEADTVTRQAVDLSAVRAMAHTALHTTAGGLEIKTVGSRSSFALVDMPGSYRRCFRVLRLDLASLQPERMTVEYRTNPSMSVQKFLPAGRFDMYLPLPVKSSVTLHFQPGGPAGLLRLHGAEILGFVSGSPDACGRPPRRQAPLTTAQPAPPAIVQADDKVSPDEIQKVTAVDSPPAGPRSRSQAGASSGQPADGKEKAGKTGDAADPGAEADADPPAVESRKPPPAVVAAAAPGGKPKTPQSPDGPADGLPAAPAGSDAAIEPPPPPAAGAAASPAITLNEFAKGRIFQRQGRAADIIVSGSYRGVFAAIEARVIHRERGLEVVPWTVVDTDPRNGIYLGVLPQVPQGGWYVLEVRPRDRPDLSVRGRHRWGVGMLIACIGQSNMKEWFHTGNDLEADPLLRVYSGDGWRPLGTTGNGAIAFGNRLIARTGIPVGLLEFAVNGSGLLRKADWGTGFWEDTRSNSIYRRFATHVAGTGGRLEFVVWLQGAADAARGTVSGDEYEASLTRFVERQVRQDIANASSRPELPFLVVGMARRPGGRDEPHQALREAQRAVTAKVAECYLAATTLDLKNEGKQHLAPEAYTTMGRRVAQTVLYVLGLEGFYRGPRVAAIHVVDATILEAALLHEGGDDIRPSAGITGWDVVDDLGAVPIRKVARHDARTIRIVLERPLTAPAEVRYLYGARPDTRRALRDNAELSLPLEAFRGVVAP